MRIGFAVWICLIVVLPTTVAADEAERGNADFTDVAVFVSSMEADLEVVRSYFGQEKASLQRFDATAASNRHAFLLAQALFRKLNLMRQETTGRSAQSPPPAPDRALTADDVMDVLRRANAQLGDVLSEYELESSTTEPRRPRSADATLAVEAMFSLLRQINLMLDRQYRPEDVYERLDLATVYVGGVLAANNLPVFPDVAFAPNKQPVEVFRKLLDCVALNQRIAEQTGTDVVRINTRRMRNSETRLSNNYDLATLMLSDIAVWTEALEGADDVFPAEVDARRIVPAHVFQKATQLEMQMQQVLELLDRP